MYTATNFKNIEAEKGKIIAKSDIVLIYLGIIFHFWDSEKSSINKFLNVSLFLKHVSHKIVLPILWNIFIFHLKSISQTCLPVKV